MICVFSSSIKDSPLALNAFALFDRAYLKGSFSNTRLSLDTSIFKYASLVIRFVGKSLMRIAFLQ